MEYSPPPLFKQGAPARVKMTLFACISVALLLADARLNALKTVRQVVGTVLYPLQMVALLPRDAIYGVGDYFSSLSSLEKQVRDLKQQQIASAQALQQAQLYNAENAQLRKLLDAREHVPGKSLLAEILYDARDSSSRKIVLDRGIQQGVRLGLPVIDNQGVVGQVTRVFPFTSEVTLLTDKEQAIPVQVLRNGLRSVAYGRGQSGQLELRFVATQSDPIQVGDILITSGLDGVYPSGLAVARVTQVENNATGAFGRVVCQPLAGIQNHSQLLILTTPPDIAPRPPEEEPFKPGKKGKAARDAAKEAAKETTGATPGAAAPQAGPAAGAPAAAVAPTATATGAPAKPATGTPAPTTGTPAKPATGTPAPAAIGTPPRATAPVNAPAQPPAAQRAPGAAPAANTTAAGQANAHPGAAHDTPAR